MKHIVSSALAVALLALPFIANAQQTGTNIKKIDKVVVLNTLATQKDGNVAKNDKSLRDMPELPVIIEAADADEVSTADNQVAQHQ